MHTPPPSPPSPRSPTAYQSEPLKTAASVRAAPLAAACGSECSDDCSTPSTKRSQEDGESAVRGTSLHNVLTHCGRVFAVKRPRRCGQLLCAARSEQAPALSELSRLAGRGSSNLNRQLSTRGIGENTSEAEAARLYALSEPVTALDGFISHTWATTRWEKALALLDSTNRWTAALSANMYVALSFALGLWVRLKYGSEVLGPAPWLLSVCVFLLAPLLVLAALLATVHELRRYVGCGIEHRRYFLDRLCIHQTNARLKQLGIYALGDAAAMSETLIILWSHDYFERLWCIFELATFVSRSPTRTIAFVPTCKPPCLFGGLLCNLLTVLLAYGLQSTPQFSELIGLLGLHVGVGVFWAVVSLVPSCGLSLLMRRKAEKDQELRTALRDFSLMSTRVSDEEDRPLLEAEIVKLFGSAAAFERYVRHDLLQSVSVALGDPWHIPYAWAAFMCQPYAWYAAVDVLSVSPEAIHAQHTEGWKTYAWGNLVFYLAQTLLVFPAAVFAVGATGRALRGRFNLAQSGVCLLIHDVACLQLVVFMCNVLLMLHLAPG